MTRAEQIIHGAKLTKKELKAQQERARIAQMAINRHLESNRLAGERRAAREAQRAREYQALVAGAQEQIAAKVDQMKAALLAWREEQAILDN